MSKESFDDILVTLGLGKWNLLYYFNVGLFGFVLPGFVLAGAFIAPNVQFECDDNQLQLQLNETTDQCTYMTFGNMTHGQYQLEEQECSEWTYTDEVFLDTLTSEFDLICDNSYLRPTYQTLLVVGSFIGSPINGFLSDRLGRKRLITIASVISVASILISTLSTNFTVMLILRFFTGFTAFPIIQTGFTLCLEVCEPKHRSTVGIILALPWAIGTVWWGVLGYLIRDWRWLMRATTIPSYVYLGFLCIMDESPRWLIVSGHHSKALKALKKAAKWNNATLPDDHELLNRMQLIQKYSRNQVESQDIREKPSDFLSKIKSIGNQIIILYRTPELRKRTLLMYIVFLVSATVFYGLSLSAVNLKLDPFMYMIVGGLTEIPAYTITIPIMIKMGRVYFTAVSYLICGVTILVLVFIPSDPKWLVITLAMIGKLCISAAYECIYLISTEVFPTEVRMQGLGTSAFVSTLGSIAAPFITELIGTQNPWIPSLIFGVMSLLAALASLFIPETLNQLLPETVMQLEMEKKPRGKKVVIKDEESGTPMKT